MAARGTAPAALCGPLAAGSLLVMAGTTEVFWKHCVPKRKRAGEARSNLWFRRVAAP
ncbi:MAG: hypothetical protein JRG96_15670 [Deltaproteobacteria bacterium]|nr:hypothetical protein [Deltaproteobacteria bacterium]MBW2421111.1 hypothetical protein [Deltaproteobacteria bacterium]